jgi:proline-specific peptidase
MPFINHKFGKTFYVKSNGSEKSGKLPIVFLHGGPGGRHDWYEPMLKMNSKRSVYLYDQIGGGQSSPTPKRLWKIETFVEELDILIRKWKLNEFHLGGGSWGTTLALEYYMRKKPQGLRSIIFQSPYFSTRDWVSDANRLISKMSKKDQKVFKYCAEIGATDSKVYQESMLAFYLKHVLRNKKKLNEIMATFGSGHGGGPKIYEHMWGPSEFSPTGTLVSYEGAHQLKRVKVPTLIMCGQHDEVTPATAQKYARCVSDCEFKVLQSCSHASISENPKLFMKTVEDFISKHD